jgi:hypothetical protein
MIRARKSQLIPVIPRAPACPVHRHLHRHCERQRSNPLSVPRIRRMDCFVASAPRNDVATKTNLRILAARNARAMRYPYRLRKAEGAGKAGAKIAPIALRVNEKTRKLQSPQVRLLQSAFPARLVLTVSFALSLVSRAFLPPSPADHPANLMPASGHPDHATSPSAI